MQIELPNKRVVSLIPAVLALAVACGGDANEEGAATLDTVSSSATGDVGAASATNPAEAVAFMSAVDSSEIQAARIATNKATNAQVREFAQMMIRDHTRSSQEIARLAQSMNVGQTTVSQQPGSMVTNVQTMAQQTLQQLNSTPRGAEFDRLYMDSQVQAHQTALENLQRIASAGATTGTATGATGTAGTGTSDAVTSPEQAAQKMIPVVQQHLDRARQIQSQLSGAR